MVEKQKDTLGEQYTSKDLERKKKGEQEKIIKEDRSTISSLAEKILLQPVKKGLESLKNLITPEKIKNEVHEKITTLEYDKQKNKKEVLIGSQHDLRELQQHIIIPPYYGEYAKKGVVEAAQSKSAQSLILDVSKKDSNPVVDLFRKVAEWGLS